MKHLIAPALLVASTGAFAQEEVPDRWVYIGKYEGGQVSIDARSVSFNRSNPIVKYWAKYDWDDGTHTNAYEEVNCETKEGRTITQARYNGGTLLGTKPGRAIWEPLIPESVGEQVGGVVCAVREQRLNENG